MPVIQKFPRDQKFLLGDRLQNHIIDVLEYFIKAYYSSNKQNKKEIIIKVNIKLEVIRYLVRLCYHSGYFNSKKYEHISALINEIGRLNGGWLKSLQ